MAACWEYESPVWNDAADWEFFENREVDVEFSRYCPILLDPVLLDEVDSMLLDEEDPMFPVEEDPMLLDEEEPLVDSDDCEFNP